MLSSTQFACSETRRPHENEPTRPAIGAIMTAPQRAGDLDRWPDRAMTHADWHVRIKRALELANRRPASALQTLRALIRTIEVSLKTGLNEWHTTQTLHIISLVQAGAGDHGGAAETLLRVTKEHEAQLNYEIRAYVSACAAAALQLAQDGDRARAKRILRQASRWSSLLRPRDKLLDQAQKTIGAVPARARQRKSAG